MKKNISWIVASALASICISSAFALAQTTVPDATGSEASQLQRVPVSGLHMGPTAQMKNPYAGNRQAWMEGKKLFNAMNCAGCHAPGGGGGMGPSLSDKVWIYGNSPGQIYLSILHGRPNGMPQWGTVLPPQAIWALVTYVETLSQPNPEFEPVTGPAAHATPAPGSAPPAPSSMQPHPSPKQAKPAKATNNATHPTPSAPPPSPSTSSGTRP